MAKQKWICMNPKKCGHIFFSEEEEPECPKCDGATKQYEEGIGIAVVDMI